MRRQFLALALLTGLAACDQRDPVTPIDAPKRPSFAVSDCASGMSASDALATLDALMAQVDALEASGALSDGRAQALRNHLRNAREQLVAGRPCPALAQLRAFRDQVTSFVGDGGLSREDAEPLLDGVAQVLVNRIAFGTRRDGNHEVYVVKTDGTDLVRLTEHPRVDAEPDWSPDGNRIVFFSARDGVLNAQGVINNGGLYVMDADGSAVTRIYFDEGTDDDLPSSPRWSPDGTRVLFSTGTFLGPKHLYVVNADGTGLTALAPSLHNVHGADWSPNGDEIVFAQGGSGASDLFRMSADASALTPLTADGTSSDPAWSPDGSRIVFVSTRDGNAEIYVMNPNGMNHVRLTTNETSDHSPRWSPDGRAIAFVSSRDGNQEVYVMNADGTGQTRVTNHSALDVNPAWRP